MCSTPPYSMVSAAISALLTSGPVAPPIDNHPPKLSPVIVRCRQNPHIGPGHPIFNDVSRFVGGILPSMQLEICHYPQECGDGLPGNTDRLYARKGFLDPRPSLLKRKARFTTCLNGSPNLRASCFRRAATSSSRVRVVRTS